MRMSTSKQKSYIDGVVLSASLSIVGFAFYAAVSSQEHMTTVEHSLQNQQQNFTMYCEREDNEIRCHGQGLSILLDLE